MKKIKIIIAVLLIAVLLMLLMFFVNPLRQSKNMIRKNILDGIPLGTTMRDATQIIENRFKWKIDYVNYKCGYSVDHDGIPGEGMGITIGKMYIRIHLGNYRNIFRTDVVAYLGFDDDSKLIDVSVRKDIDGF